MTTLHIFGQQFEHDDAHLFGTVESLISLRDAINNAIENGEGYAESFCSDGEGFGINIFLCADDEINQLPLPYKEFECNPQEKQDFMIQWLRASYKRRTGERK